MYFIYLVRNGFISLSLAKYFQTVYPLLTKLTYAYTKNFRKYRKKKKEKRNRKEKK